MPDATDQRPPVAVGHVHLTVTDVGAAARWLETVGLRPIARMDALAVLELRGGTHVVVRQVERPTEPGTRAPFDLMVDDVELSTPRLRRKRVVAVADPPRPYPRCVRSAWTRRLGVHGQLLARQRPADLTAAPASLMVVEKRAGSAAHPEHGARRRVAPAQHR